jgi:dodecin
MSIQVAKVIEINCSSTKGIEDAVEKGLKKASQTIKNIKGAWVNELKVVTNPDGKVTEWRVNLKVTFIVD